MKQVSQILTKTFIYLLPFAVAVIFCSQFDFMESIVKFPNLVLLLAVVMMAWLVAGIYFFLALTFNSHYRERTLVKLANIRERDEREERIVGHASRQTFLIMLAVLISLFALSTVRYDFTQKTADDSTRSITIGHFSLFDLKPEMVTSNHGGVEHQYQSYSIPLSKTGLLLLMVGVQLAAFKLTARREIQRGEAA